MKRVVLVNQSSGYLMTDIANAYIRHYDEVVLIAGTIQPNERPLDSRIKVDRICAYDRTSALSRLWTWLKGTRQIYTRLKHKYKGFKVVYVTNPPTSYLLSLFLDNDFSIIVYDIYPEALRNIGIGKSNPLYRLWSRWNKSLFARASVLYTLSDGMARQLGIYGSAEKIRVIPNWSASSKLHPIPKANNRFIKEQHLSDKFIVMYSGNIGYTHNVEYIVEIARQLKDIEQIYFLIIGEGRKKKTLQDLVARYGLTNCSFLTWQRPEMLPYSLTAADVAVVTLNDETASVSVPSKTYNLLAAGAPLLCIASEDTELHRLISRYDNGRCFDKNDVQSMAEYVLALWRDPNMRERLSCNSQIASQDFTYLNAQNYV